VEKLSIASSENNSLEDNPQWGLQSSQTKHHPLRTEFLREGSGWFFPTGAAEKSNRESIRGDTKTVYKLTGKPRIS